MGPVTPNQLLGVLVAILLTPTVFLLIKSYLRTRITDYLIFASFLFFAGFALIADPLASSTNLLIFYQLHHISIDSAVFSISLHASRVIWSKIPKLFLILSSGYYLFLFVLTMSWHLMIQPDVGKFLFFDIKHSYSSYFPLGAGLTIGNVIIYSTAFRYFGEIYRTIIILFLVWAYIKIKPVETSPRIIWAKRLWIISWLFVLIHAFSLFPWTNITDVVSIFLIISGVLIVFITLTIPEALLISHIQVYRLLKVYDSISKTDKTKYLSMVDQNKRLFDYLQSIQHEFENYNNEKNN